MAFAFIFLVGAILAVGVGVTLIVLSRRGGLPYPSCGGCRYDVSGSVGQTTRCPECGAAFTDVGIVPAGPRRRVGLLIAGIGIVLIMTTCVGGSVALTLAQHAEARAAQRRAAAAQMQALQAQQAAIQARDEAAGLESEDEDGIEGE